MIRWAALVVTDRRWAAPMASMALCFGLFIGVAVGPPGASFATSAPQIIRVPAPEEEKPAPEESEPDDSGGGSSGGGGSGSDSFDQPLTTPPILTSPIAPAPAPVTPAPEAEDDETAPGTDTEEPSDEQTLAGTVVHANPAADSYALAATGGALYALHARKLPDPGTRVKLPVRQLANGTYAEDGKLDTSGKRASAEIAGTVTFVDDSPEAPGYTVSSPGSSVLVHVEPKANGSAPSLPQLGAFVTVTGKIEKPPASERRGPGRAADPTVPPPTTPPPDTPPVDTPPPTTTPPVDTPPPTGEPAPSCAPDPTQPAPKEIEPVAIITETSIDGGGEPGTYSDFAGIVGAVCEDTGELLLSADDIRESGQDLLFSVPEGISVSKLEVGDSVAATATIAEDGALELAGLSSDEGTKGADDEKLVQGDLAR